MTTETLPESTRPSPADRAATPAADPRLALEWLETDGCGGYASSTPLLCHTRRYHGLLVAPFAGTARRHVFLSRFDEVLRESDGRPHAISMARYPGLHAPRGDRALFAFELAPHPVATYDLGVARVRREVRMVRGAHTVLVRYFLEHAAAPLTLELRPILPSREADALTIENDQAVLTVDELPGGVRCRPYADLPALALTVSRAVAFEADPVWYRNLEYQATSSWEDWGSARWPHPG